MLTLSLFARIQQPSLARQKACRAKTGWRSVIRMLMIVLNNYRRIPPMRAELLESRAWSTAVRH